MSKVWLVTGSASGLGRDIVEAACAAGHKVLATARNTGPLTELCAEYGEHFLTTHLDVTNEAQAQDAVAMAVEHFGRLDVLVNNAGYGDVRPFEETSSADFKTLVDTVFYGVVNLTRAALPTMRTQRSGTIMQISSVGGRLATAGSASYHAAKWAVSGFTESLAQETAPFGVKVVALEPAAIRTKWGTRATQQRPAVMQDYEPSVGAAIKSMEGLWGNEPIDPARIAQIMLRLAEAEHIPAHLLIGSSARDYYAMVEGHRANEAERWREVSISADFNAGPIPPVPAA
ncbi:SDR family NAD(P)-dependent oxidoreductase [Dyella solisilvae]|uniref:SDR family NAD(P)-dependent oxidoreductase n=1 Tax=Dyella solisilvae TaxID=1920168 RepID=A0A370K9P5_9GAMM|nr:SDR family NAD(P)-dependent oxidoreductase [Dyella solisilvae]RDI99345.1 SDR family NAD(P)-dependent oxidoreductase [Dyella solisilvae]